MSSKVMIISADCHVGLPFDGYDDYFEQRHLDDYHRWAVERRRWQIDHVRNGVQKETGQDFARYEEVTGRLGEHHSVWDPTLRMKDLDQDGVTAEVLYPTGPDFAVPFGRPQYSVELTVAGERAYTRWLADFCSHNPQREAGIGYVPYHDMDEAVKTIRWIADAGLRGVILPANDPLLPLYHDPYWEPVWTACEELGLPLNVHPGRGGGPVVDYGSLPSSSLVSRMEHGYFNRRPLWFLILGGVLERHPGLKLVFTELQADWIPEVLANIDSVHARSPMAREICPLRPSEYWARQCFVGVSIMSRVECDLRDDIGIRSFMFGTDYPHHEGTWWRNGTAAYLRATLGACKVPEDEARLMLGENAARCYGFDVDALASTADRVGPEMHDLLRAPSIDEEAELRDSFVFTRAF